MSKGKQTIAKHTFKFVKKLIVNYRNLKNSFQIFFPIQSVVFSDKNSEARKAIFLRKTYKIVKSRLIIKYVTGLFLHGIFN